MTNGNSAPPPGLSREEAQAFAGVVALLLIAAAWWALALWPVASGPAWLERTRYACFGVAGNGLPDVGGWIGLIGGPLGMLLILVVGWRAAFGDLLSRARTSRPAAAALASVALGAFALVTSAGVRVHQARDPGWVAEAETLPPASYPRLDRAAPSLALTGQHGEPLDLASLRGSPVLVTFAFAHCQTVCPLVVRDVLAARRALVGSGMEPAVLIVTLDPWRDTPSRLPAMAKGWDLPDDGAWVLTGSVAEVEAVLDAWDVPRTRDTTTGEVTHPSLVYVVDSAGGLAFASTGGAEALVSLVRRL
ncbi:MAG TPA: SCO family protein [Longimicrobiales bacterium]|nr:SCO family protein [Longimicrobiales bacterium]